MSAAGYLNPPAIAKRFHVKQQIVGEWIRTGELKAVDVSERRGGRPRWRVSQQALDEFLATRSNRKPAATPRRKRQVKLVEFFK